jgi:predicted small metal-binding protein
MKRFACGDIIPGCDAVFTAADEDGIFAQAAPHAASEHGITADQITPELMDRFRAAMVTV